MSDQKLEYHPKDTMRTQFNGLDCVNLMDALRIAIERGPYKTNVQCEIWQSQFKQLSAFVKQWEADGEKNGYLWRCPDGCWHYVTKAESEKEQGSNNGQA